MTTASARPSLRRRLEVGRLVVGSLLEVGIKAYGAGAVASVAMSDAETVGGKARDALAAVPTLAEHYRDAKYVVDHREEIQAAIDYVNQHTLPQAELEDAANRSSDTLHDIETTYSRLGEARDAFPNPKGMLEHLGAAWDARPDRDSIAHLADVAEQAGPYIDQVGALIPVYYGGLLAVMDNFASDEIGSTLGVMALAFGLAFLLGRAVGFWVRRGRPGLLARMLQRWGARTFRRWYVRNLPRVLGAPVYAVARERIQRDIVADPRGALDPEVLRELESYFRGRPSDDSAPPPSPVLRSHGTADA